MNPYDYNSLSASPDLSAEEKEREKRLLAEAAEVAGSLYGLSGARVARIPGGRVNETFLVNSGQERFILQRLNDFFQGDESLGLNWLRIWQAVADRSGQAAPPLPPIYPDCRNRYLTVLPDGGGAWRLTGFIEAQPAPKTPAGALAAARLLGRLHSCLNYPAPLGLLPLPEGEFTNQRLNRPPDFMNLLEMYRGHPHLPAVEPLVEQAAEAAAQLPFFPCFIQVFGRNDVVIHGDPKADNFLFSPSGDAYLLDWDSAGYGHVLVDVAEMLRSWGGAALETDETRQNMAAVMEGYGQTGLPLEEGELEMLPPVLRAIALNLCRRYLTDALAEVYFKWDCRKYPSLHYQNKYRAKIMLNIAEYLLSNEIILIEVIKKAYARGLNPRFCRDAVLKTK